MRMINLALLVGMLSASVAQAATAPASASKPAVVRAHKSSAKLVKADPAKTDSTKTETKTETTKEVADPDAKPVTTKKHVKKTTKTSSDSTSVKTDAPVK